MILVPVAANAQTPATPASTSSDQLLKAEELDALVAPIALYPDTLLSLVLMASTYPLEVIQAERWVRENKLKGYCEVSSRPALSQCCSTVRHAPCWRSAFWPWEQMDCGSVLNDVGVMLAPAAFLQLWSSGRWPSSWNSASTCRVWRWPWPRSSS